MLHFLPNYSDAAGAAATNHRAARAQAASIPGGLMPRSRSRRAPMRAIKVTLTAILALLLASAAYAAGDATDPAAPPAQGSATAKKGDGQANRIDADKLFGAIVRVATRAVPEARTTESLGSEREGTGVVIGNDGLILTIGYLVMEAEDVKITDAKGRTLPARVVGCDDASGFALLRALVPLDATPIALGDSSKTAEREPVLIATAGGDGTAFAWIVSKRAFTGNWEYKLDYALFTSPPTANWSGAALIDRDGKLVGIGSLIVPEATDGEPKLPGNLFVPIDLLKPILADLVTNGRRAGPAQPWLGVAADELQGHLFVTRVAPGGPAERAGVSVGDIILGVGPDAVQTQAEFYERVWKERRAGDAVPLRVLHGMDVREITVVSMDRGDYYRSQSTI
jgi:S1-C subfamily serine protease